MIAGIARELVVEALELDTPHNQQGVCGGVFRIFTRYT